MGIGNEQLLGASAAILIQFAGYVSVFLSSDIPTSVCFQLIPAISDSFLLSFHLGFEIQCRGSDNRSWSPCRRLPSDIRRIMSHSIEYPVWLLKSNAVITLFSLRMFPEMRPVNLNADPSCWKKKLPVSSCCNSNI